MTVTDASYRALKRLQVATGVLPIGLFLLLHLVTNGHALQGPRGFNDAVARIWRLPLVAPLELAGIALPMVAHVALGIVIAQTAQAAEDVRGFRAPWRLAAQRATGFFLVVYVGFHVWSTRLSAARLGGATDLFGLMAKQLAEPGWLLFHVLGVLAAAFHFGNGLASLAGPWGLALGERAQRRAERFGLAAGVAAALVGLHALLAFVVPALRWLEPAR